MVSKWQLKRRQRSEAQLQRAAAAATSASEIPEASRVEAFLFFPLQHFFEPFSLVHVRFPTLLCSPPPPPPYTLGFSAGELPAWPQRRCICLQHSRFGSALFLRPFAGVTAEWEQGMPLPHVPLPRPDPPPLVGDHLLISSFALASPPASFFAVLQLLEPSLLCDSPHRPLSRERRCGQR